ALRIEAEPLRALLDRQRRKLVDQRGEPRAAQPMQSRGDVFACLRGEAGQGEDRPRGADGEIETQTAYAGHRLAKGAADVVAAGVDRLRPGRAVQAGLLSDAQRAGGLAAGEEDL